MIDRERTAPPAEGRADAIRDEAREQWGHDPAGGLAAGDEPLGSRDSFERVERYRYQEQPWMHDTFRFERFAGERVLEVGVGLGTDHIQFARAGAEMTGVDLTPRCVELTRARLEQEGLRPNVSVMDAESLSFDDDSFDAVYSFGVLHHIPHSEAAFREIRRVLRPGGTFLGALYNKHSAFYARVLAGRYARGRFRHESIEETRARIEYSTGDATPHVRLFTRRELAGALRDAGFERVTIRKRHLGLGRHRNLVPARLDELGGNVAGWYLVHDAA